MKLRLSAIGTLTAATMAIVATACGQLNDDRIPPVAVNVDIGNPGYWDIYGVHGLGQSRTFVKSLHIPSNFPYTANSFTGFGGILLVTDMASMPLAYDLACPVEVSRDVRVVFDSSTLLAVCPRCGSEYNVCEYLGAAVSGEAHTLRYALTRYRVISTTTGGYVIVR